MKKTLRTFVAVEISEAICARATELIAALSEKGVRNRLCEASEGPFRKTVPDTFFVKWVEPCNLHLTLKFLGEVHQREIPRVCRAVELGAAEVAPFPLDVRGAGAFPNAARPRTVWLGAGEGAEQMVRLHDRVEAALAELGYREEHRRFQVHLTIGRVRGGGPGIVELGSLLEKHADFSAGKMTVERVTVFASQLTPAGPIYEVLGSARLGRS
ncbi:MAG: RNA 2',3'-cyclic phosphodiesterase [Planctomycetes bacterium]|nr:RNA 2',3'-cyclic phosphodiesterase [Planctomycetota bacterium]MBU4399537.1 RNA 2',3'-cyclic phosphodiesterase [Planctomycetota bacterium]MCG2685536.1 RNA 2',3'-cyclic phosphodiesterase [Planctomycetales bacterium]